MIGLMLAAAALQHAPPVADMQRKECTEALCGTSELRPFLRKLAGARRGREPVRIIQIGDSHTAADQITGGWRALLQARYGDGGRGVLAPGRPYQGYLTRSVTVSQAGSWTVDAIFGPSYHAAGAPRGLSQYSFTATIPGATFALRSDRGTPFDRLEVCALKGPNAGALQLSIGATSVEWDLNANQAEPDCRRIDAEPSTTAAVTLVRGNATITSWSTSRQSEGGVILSNLGTVGAQFIHFGRTDDAVLARELRQYRPDLIVIAFGTNEAFRPRFVAAEYEASLAASLRRIRRLAPDVPILVLGAPDSATKQPGLMANAVPESDPCGADTAWRPTAALDQVQAIQRRAALAMGAAFWDWSLRMGGRCVSVDWANQSPPQMRGDRVHFTTPGAAQVAQLLDQDIAHAADLADGEPR